uniref:Uncharacterized protein n=1 Tax=Heliothis virescens TaxID=7102 RepID=A0A2A4JJZ4_HELVI
MKREIPVCTRCCFCLPLRRGLLAWGYIKIIADIIFILMMLYVVIIVVWIIMAFTGGSIWAAMCTEVIMGVIGIVVCLVDIAMTVVFIVGGHKKNVKLIRVFYIHSIVLCVVSAILSTLTILLHLIYSTSIQHVETMVMNATTCLGILVLQCYFVFLIRSEIIKLRSNCEFRFVNNAAEAECIMEIGDNLPKEHSIPEPVLEKDTESDDEVITSQPVELV